MSAVTLLLEVRVLLNDLKKKPNEQIRLNKNYKDILPWKQVSYANRPNKDGFTALHFAVINNHTGVVAKLLVCFLCFSQPISVVVTFFFVLFVFLGERC